ncbi:hypothetical protein SAMN05428953_12685 [Mesorhizobium muleiense]|uniref:Uncharacterized protein n=1 Tax=Mesorhizobium muleiense TaxID=1004279 RepID=A0A1G9H6G1_9HYPH|nr:hypothetical protein [Mesorhizobium muleiense]SDL08588.1 hypothetical protein SAMN05428953_12685 [Mesorhizobium muleiense]
MVDAADLKHMFEIDPDILRAPRRDNSAYLETIARMRKAALDAEIALGGSVYIFRQEIEESDGNYIIKTEFRRVGE